MQITNTLKQVTKVYFIHQQHIITNGYRRNDHVSTCHMLSLVLSSVDFSQFCDMFMLLDIKRSDWLLHNQLMLYPSLVNSNRKMVIVTIKFL